MSVLFTGRAQVLVDLVGYYTGSGSAAGTDGLFVPILTTEPSTGQTPAGSTVSVTVTPPLYGPSVAALLLEVDARTFASPGFVNAWGSGPHPWTTDISVDAPNAIHTGSTVTALAGSSFRTYVSANTWMAIYATGVFTAAT